MILAVLLIFSSKIFRVEVDERVTEVTDMLPGANCGGCGYPGCAQFAKALVADEAPVDGCSVGGAATAEAVAKYLGKVTPPQKERTRAYIFCHGHKDIAKSNQVYNGAQTCVFRFIMVLRLVFLLLWLEETRIVLMAVWVFMIV